MMTPLDKFKSLPNTQQYLKPEMTFDMLDRLASKQSDFDVWGQLQKARSKLFDSIFGQTPKVA